jgi:two-component system, NarL family, nitrate/nitrite response regulator NarL
LLNIRTDFKVTTMVYRQGQGDVTLPPIAELSPEEKAILSYVLQGNTNAVIARQLGVTEAIAKGRLRRLLRKINVENRTQAVIWALANQPELDTPCGYV